MSSDNSWNPRNIMKLVSDETRGHKRIPTAGYQLQGRTPVVDQSQILVAGYTEEPSTLTDPPYIVFGDHTREIKYLDHPFLPGAQGVRILKATQEADPKFLYHYLAFNKVQNLGYSRHFKLFKQIEIHLPPLAEQQRIAEILDVSQQAKQNLHRAIQNYSALSSQLVETAVGKSEHNATLESLASISGGLALSKRRAELTLSVPYLRVANVFRNRIDLTEVKEMGCTPDEAGRTELRIGDILMTEAHGNRNEVGRVAMVDQPLENFSYQNHLFRIRGSGTLPPLVLTHLINSRFVHQQLVQLATTTSGLKTISISKARRLQIPILGEQEALDLNDQLERIRCLSEKTRKKLARVKELQDSLSTHAFAGQL